MGLRDGLSRARCKLGLHAGEWEPAGACERVNTCLGCGNVRTRTEHELTGWAYASPDDETSCLMERHCTRCGLAETAVRHEPRWQYESDGRCEGQRCCERCGTASGERAVRHHWGPWMPDRNAAPVQNPLSLRANHMVRSCLRCAEQEQMKLPAEHAFVRDNPFLLSRVNGGARDHRAAAGHQHAVRHRARRQPAGWQ